MNNNTDVIQLEQIRWRTILSKRVDEFIETISDDEVFKQYFGEKYIEKLTEKSKNITRIMIKLSVLYAILMLSLFASQNIDDTGFELFGYGFKNISHYKEILLLLASLISPFNISLGAYQKYINSLIKESLKKLSPNENIRKFYSQKFIDDYFGGLVYERTNDSTSLHGLTVFMLALFIFLLFFLLIALLVGSFFIQVSVIMDIINQPSSPYYINIFVVTIAITSIFYSLVITILQLPMPEVVNNYSKLSKMKTTDPDKYISIMKKLADENDKNDKRSTLIISSIIYISSFTVISIYFVPSSFNDFSLFLTKAMVGFFYTIVLSILTIKVISNRIWAWFFRKYKDKQNLTVFNRLNKLRLLLKIFLPLIITIAYSYNILAP